MYAQIVVLTYQSPSIDSYTYKIPAHLIKEIKIGSLVQIPFGKRKPYGVVISLTNLFKGEIDLKYIENIILEEFFLPYQIKLLLFLKKYYISSTINCLETMIPPIPKKINRPEHVKTSLFQTLVLVPNINKIPEILAEFPQAKNHFVYHNELSMSGKFTAWQNIHSGKHDYIFATRSGIFTPLVNLKKIIIYEEHNDSFKDERSPYFDTITVAEKVAELTKAKLEIIDTSPKITTFYSLKDKIKIPKSEIKVKTISMEEERIKGNQLPLSDYVIEVLKRAQMKNKSILLFLNKKQESGFIYCRNCKYQQFQSTKIQECPNCNSKEIWFNTNNIFSLSDVIKKIIPKAEVKILSKNSSLLPTTHNSIDIATSSIFYDLPISKYAVAVHVSLSSTLNVKSFTSNEKAYQQITSLKNKIEKNGLLILQTFNSENNVVKMSETNNYLKMYKTELIQRQLLKYPPYALLIKISIKGKKVQTIERKSKQLSQDLKLEASKLKNPPTILGPFKPIFTENAIRFNILIKIPMENYSLNLREKTIESYNQLFKNIPRYFQVTVEPNNLN